MHSIDYLIVFAYFAIVLLISAKFCKGQKSLKDYFLGSRSIPWWAAMFSGIATVVSAISYLGAPGLAFAGDYTYHQLRLAFPLALGIMIGIMLPHFYHKERISIYQYLEERFDLKTRFLTSLLFLGMKTCYMGLAMYAPALVLQQVIDLPIIVIIMLVGIFTTIYTVSGGMKAVIWTDSLQLFILLGGLLMVIVVVLGKIDGGFIKIVEIANENHKFRFFNFSASLTEKYTFWGGLFGGLVAQLTQLGVDQSELQRFLTTKTFKQSVYSVIGTYIVTFIFGLFVFFIGTTLFVFYSQFPEKGAFNITSNEVFPKFIIEEMPLGLKGLLVAGVLAAAMSTISSLLNSVTAVFVTDFYNRMLAREATVKLARSVTIILGIIGILMASIMGSLGNIIELALKFNSLFGGPLVGIFLIGMLNRAVTSNATFSGLCIGISGAIYLEAFTDVAFLWIGVFSATATMFFAILLTAVPKIMRA